MLPTNLSFLTAAPTPDLLPANTVPQSPLSLHPASLQGSVSLPAEKIEGLARSFLTFRGSPVNPPSICVFPQPLPQYRRQLSPALCMQILSSLVQIRLPSPSQDLILSQSWFLSCGLSFSLSTGSYKNTAALPLDSILSPATALPPCHFIRVKLLGRVLRSHSSNFPACFSVSHLFPPNDTPAPPSRLFTPAAKDAQALPHMSSSLLLLDNIRHPGPLPFRKCS